jgi:hypothetical protein
LVYRLSFSYDALSRRTQLTRPNGINTDVAALFPAGSDILTFSERTSNLK